MTRVRFRNRAELRAAVEAGAFAGRAVHLTVLHDAECGPSRCVCEPEFMIEDATPAALAAGLRAQSAWERGTSA